VLHSGDAIPASAIQTELKSHPALRDRGGEGPESLSTSVERYLTQYFFPRATGCRRRAL